MNAFDSALLSTLYHPSPFSHKGDNGKLLLIGGSQLFHAASLWPLTIASRIVDMVFYSSVPINNEIVLREKDEFRNGIVVPREKIEAYIKEADCILIGPGLPRSEGVEEGDDNTKTLTETLLTRYREKKWVVDGGSLQSISPDVLPKGAIITPHKREFTQLFGQEPSEETVQKYAKVYDIIILLKGERDIVASKDEAVVVKGGNAGMTKGGTGDVLAGLVASLNCKNSGFLSACAGSYINKKAGESLFKKVGFSFNASDLANEIPIIMKSL